MTDFSKIILEKYQIRKSKNPTVSDPVYDTVLYRAISMILLKAENI